MKKLNYVLLTALLFVSVSCSKEDTADNYSVADENSINGVEIIHQGLLRELFTLKQNKSKLERNSQINGQIAKQRLATIETNITELTAFNDYVDRFRPIGPIGPIPLPRPRPGCFKEANCQPLPPDFTDFPNTLTFGKVNVVAFEIKNDRNETVSGRSSISKDASGTTLVEYERNFTGQATMYITIDTEMQNMGNMVIDMPVKNF